MEGLSFQTVAVNYAVARLFRRGLRGHWKCGMRLSLVPFMS